MNNNIILCFGFMAGIGKDLIGKYLIKKYNFKRLAFGDEVKSDVSKFNDITVEYLEQNKEIYRDQLITHGENKRKKNPYYWIDKTFKGIDIGNLSQNLILTDVRRINELKWLKEMNNKYNNIYIIEIIKPNQWDEDIETIKSIVYGNYFNCFYDKIINNSTKEDLYEKIDDILKNINYNNSLKI